ncbi:MAG TPA: peptidoglycan bridge formation glycyltransferase FemA/FemB family protein [Dictyobacter sp.]|jgi:lipid II:glycine glycyltransferase (peptidoglycan interpeptide bridge formation enzyme)|nr:peptidoglycan bridge formation glycyltransferase FemA/FemB family protein [Dictyobacter sp.]
MEARIITDRQQWNDFIRSSSYCNIKQSYEWGEFGSYLGADDTMHIGVIDEAGKLCAALLMTVSRAPMLKQTYFYAPRGPIIEDPDSPAMTVLLNYVKAEARKRHAFMLKIEPAALHDDLSWLTTLRRRGFHVNPHHMHIRNEWVLDISPDEKTLLSGMKEKWRYNIRLAGRKGIKVRQAESAADLDTWYELYQVTSERDKFFINQKEFYVDILQAFRKDNYGALFLAEYEGKAVAGTIVLVEGPWSYYMYGASSNEHREKMPNHLLQWTGIQWAKSRGARYYNFGGIPEILAEGQELYGVYLFKRGFGGYPMCSLPTHDLVYNPLLYWAYRSMLDVKHKLDENREKRLVTQAVHPTSPNGQVQAAKEQTKAQA